jgi:uncharacterized protein YjbI with pentapeptide repeats
MAGERGCGYRFDAAEWERSNDFPGVFHPDGGGGESANLDDDGVWHCPHDPVDGRDRCVFHLAPAERPADVDAASAFVDVVAGRRDGPPTFVGAVVPAFDCSGETLASEATVDLRRAHLGDVDWSGATVDAKVDARAAVVEDDVDLSGATLGASLDLSRATVQESTVLDEVTVGGLASFLNATFGGQFNARAAAFRGGTSFAGVQFGGDFNVRNTEFSHSGHGVYPAENSDYGQIARVLSLTSARVEGEAVFHGVTAGWRERDPGTDDAHVTFGNTDFESGANFGGATFGTTVSYEAATFGGPASFQRVDYRRDVRFDDVAFGGSASFSGAFEGHVSFRRATFDGSATFGHDGMLPYDPFAGRADFGGATFATAPRFSVTYRAPNDDDSSRNIFDDGPDLKGTSAVLASAFSFADATFRDGPDLSGVRAVGRLDLSGATMAGADLSGADLSTADADLSGADLTRSNLRHADLSGVDLEDADLSRSALYGADLSNALLYGTLLSDARISDATDFGVEGRERRLPFLTPSPDVAYDTRSEPLPDPGEVSNYTRAATTYAEIESVAHDNAASRLASTCFLWRKDMQRKRYRSGTGDGNRAEHLSWLRSTVANLVVRYGESPYRVVSQAGVVIFVCGLLYWALDLLAATDDVADPSLVDAMYFSTLTFTTLGLGDFRPVGDLGRALAIFETSAGVVLLALLVFVFGRRATR